MAGLTHHAAAAIHIASTASSEQTEFNLDDYPKLDADDLPEEQRLWLEEEARWIITDDERDVFLRLDTDARCETFVRMFWEVRDPHAGHTA